MKALLLICLCLLPVLANAAPAKQIVLPVTLSYQGRTISANMVLDTGASTTTIGPDLADRLGIPRSTGHGGTAQLADGRPARYQTAVMDVTVAAMARTGLDVNIMEYSGVRQVDGWLGLNFLADLSVTIDWKNRRISWSE